jgi:hypothetical protein
MCAGGQQHKDKVKAAEHGEAQLQVLLQHTQGWDRRAKALEGRWHLMPLIQCPSLLGRTMLTEQPAPAKSELKSACAGAEYSGKPAVGVWRAVSVASLVQVCMYLTCTVLPLSKCPPTGLAAAMMDVRAGRLATSPALATDTSCCSIASSSACSSREGDVTCKC